MTNLSTGSDVAVSLYFLPVRLNFDGDYASQLFILRHGMEHDGKVDVVEQVVRILLVIICLWEKCKHISFL